MTPSTFALRTYFLVGGVVTALFFAADRSAQAQVSANRGRDVSQRSNGRGDHQVQPLIGDEWQVVPQILSSIPAVVGDGFGSACAMNEDGTILVVGASDATVDEAAAVGAVHIYTYSILLHAWEHVQMIECPPKIVAGNPAGSPGLALFGWSVAISGTTIVVGAPVVSPAFGPSLAGRAYVFQQNSADNLWGNVLEGERVANKIIGPLDPEMIGYFGGSVAVDVVGPDDTRIVVGSPFRGTANQGGVYIFEGSGSTFTQKKFLLPEDVVGQDQFGSKVAIDGNAVVVGAQLADTDDLINNGAAYVYRRTIGLTGTWGTTPEAILTRVNGLGDDGFGSSISIIDNTIAVGAPGTDRGVVASGLFVVGTSYTIKVAGTTNFTLIGAANNDVGALFTATGVGIGTGTAYATSSNNGSAFVYRFTAGFWVLEDEVFAREANPGNAFGYSLGLSLGGDQLIVGCPGYETTSPSGINAGVGFAFTRTGGVWDRQASDLWTPSARTSQGVGEQTAVSRDGQKAVVGSRHNVSAAPFSTPIANNMFASTFGEAPTAGGAIVVGTVPPTPDAPGADGFASTIPTTGTGTGGGTPTTGGFGGASAAIPALPTIETWGLVRASVVVVDRAASRISIILTDGNGQLETNGKSIYPLGFYDPTWTVLGLGDVNGDGSSDVLFLNPATRKVKAWIRLGHTIAETVTVGTITDGDRFMGISDWNGNGFEGPAFLHADGHSAAFWIVQGGAVTSKTEWELGAGNWTFRTAELTGDTRPDLIARDADANKLLRVIPSLTGATLVDIVNPGPSSRLAAAQDFDGDGTTDFLWEDSSTNKLEFYFLNSNGSIRFHTPWDSNLSGWRIDPAANFSAGGGTGVMFSKGGAEVLVLTVRFEPLATLPAGRGNIRVDYSRVLGTLDDGYTILGTAEEP